METRLGRSGFLVAPWWPIECLYMLLIMLACLHVYRLRVRQLFHSGRGTCDMVWIAAVRGA